MLANQRRINRPLLRKDTAIQVIRVLKCRRATVIQRHQIRTVRTIKRQSIRISRKVIRLSIV